jgi:agmatine deiminase
MPAEWEPHEATWIAWPHNKDDWPGKFAAIPLVYAEIVRHVHQSEEVHILVNGQAGEAKARSVLEHLPLDHERIKFHRVATNRVWIRDYAPFSLFMLQPGPPAWLGRTFLLCGFNAWAKYPNHQRDAKAGRKLIDLIPKEFWMQGMHKVNKVILEGGSIDTNGRGCLLTTEECLLSKVQQRNPGMKRADYEEFFWNYLLISKVLWLGKGIAGDDTHGHVDDLARFVGPRTVVVASEDNPRDVNYKPLKENYERLQGMTDQDGKTLEVLKLPMPAPVWWAGQRLPASYANFYIANDRVLVPTFNDPNDRKALGVLAELFPGRTVVGIHAVDLVWGLGTLHCLTQQQPAVPS